MRKVSLFLMGFLASSASAEPPVGNVDPRLVAPPAAQMADAPSALEMPRRPPADSFSSRETAPAAPSREWGAGDSVKKLGKDSATETKAPPPPGYGKLAAIASQDMLQLRDPFKRPEVESKGPDRTDLENYSVESFRMVGLIAGPRHTRAMLEGPDGKTYFVTEKSKIGTRQGYVRRISPQGVFIREKVVNLLGEEEDLETVLKMSSSVSAKAAH